VTAGKEENASERKKICINGGNLTNN